MKESMTISVVVVAKEADNIIKHLFSSLSEQERKPDEVLIIVDNLDDNTLKMVGFPSSVRVVLNEKGGLGAARNKGLIEAQGDYVVFIDADAFADSGLLKSVEKFFSEKPSVVAQAGPIVNVGSYEEIYKIRLKAKLQSLAKKWKNVDSVGFWPTNNFSVKKAIAMNIGGFKEDIHYAGEDMLFCNKLKELGHKIAFNPNALVYHIYYGHRGSVLRRHIRNGKGRAEIFRYTSLGTLLMPLAHIGLIFVSVFGIVVWANLMYGIFALLSLFHRFYRVYVYVVNSACYMPITMTLLEENPLTYISYFVTSLWTPISWLRISKQSRQNDGMSG